MVDRVSSNGLNELNASQLSQSQHIEQVNHESAGSTKGKVVDLFADKVDISDAAKALLRKEEEVQGFARIAQQMDEEYNSEKVSYFKDLVDSGRISQYLRGLSNDDLADSLLDSPTGAIFGQ